MLYDIFIHEVYIRLLYVATSKWVLKNKQKIKGINVYIVSIKLVSINRIK